MSIKQRLIKLEETSSPELLNVILEWHSDRSIPLPEPHISGAVLVSYRYVDDKED